MIWPIVACVLYTLGGWHAAVLHAVIAAEASDPMHPAEKAIVGFFWPLFAVLGPLFSYVRGRKAKAP